LGRQDENYSIAVLLFPLEKAIDETENISMKRLAVKEAFISE